MPYTLQFGTRAHVVDDQTASVVLEAMRNGDRTVQVTADLAGDGTEYEITLNVANVIALVKHREPNDADLTLRARNALGAFNAVFDGPFASCDISERRAVLARLAVVVATATAAHREPLEDDGR
jgi:hypothetical protein